MSNGPVAKARRSQKFLAKMSKRENPLKFLVALPPDVAQLDEISWQPDKFERMATWLDEARKRWAKEDDQRRTERLKELLAAVEADRKAGLI